MGTCNSSSKYHRQDISSDENKLRFPIEDKIVHKGSILSMNNNDNFILCSSDDKLISLFDYKKLINLGEYQPSYYVGHTSAVNRAILNPLGDHIFSASRDLSIKLWNIETKQCIDTIPDCHTLNITALQNSYFDNSFISGSRDYSVKKWDNSTLQLIHEFKFPRNIVTDLTTRPTDPLIYQGSEDLSIRCWDQRDKSTFPAVHITGFVYFPLSLDIQKKGNILASSCKGFNGVGCGVMLWDLRNVSKPLKEFSGHTHDTVSCKFYSSQDQYLVSVSKDGSLFIWNVETYEQIASFSYPEKYITSLSINSNFSGNEDILFDIYLSANDGSISIFSFFVKEKLIKFVTSSKAHNDC